MNLLLMALIAVLAAPAGKGDVDTGALGWLCGGMGAVCTVFFVLLALVPLVGLCKVFAKAGQPAWAALIPFYNTYVLCEIIKKPDWFIFTFIPCLNIYYGIMICFELAKVFGKESGFAIGIILLPAVFISILGFGSAEYEGGRRKRRPSRDYDDDDDDRPRRRARDDDDDEDDRPRGRRARDDDDEDDDRPRPKRRPRDDDDD